MNRPRLFAASCVALVTTSMVFSIRGDILDALGRHFHLTNHQLGVILSPAFWGFTVSIMLGGSIVDFLGMKRLFLLSSAGYVGSVLLILGAPAPAGPVTPYYSDAGFICLYIGFLTLGLSQGLVEGVINPLCSAMYPDDKTRRFAILHAWWPGGLVIGGLAAYGLTRLLALDAPGLSASAEATGWRLKLGLLIVPAVAYALMSRAERFPDTERVAAGISHSAMFREALRPLFLLLLACMLMTAAAELGPSQWVPSLITTLTGMQGVLILVYTAGLMFLLRFFGSHLAHRLSPPLLLTISSALTAAGLFLLAGADTAVSAFASATVFGIGVAFFWPIMLSVTSEQFPRGGAFLLAIMGGAGNLAVAFILPVMGTWYDAHGASAAFRYVAVLPIVLTVVFAGLTVYFRSRGGYAAITLPAGRPGPVVH